MPVGEACAVPVVPVASDRGTVGLSFGVVLAFGSASLQAAGLRAGEGESDVDVGVGCASPMRSVSVVGASRVRVGEGEGVRARGWVWDCLWAGSTTPGAAGGPPVAVVESVWSTPAVEPASVALAAVALVSGLSLSLSLLLSSSAF